MVGNQAARPRQHSDSLPSPSRGARRFRLAPLGPLCLTVLMISTGFNLGWASADPVPCDPGWRVVAEVDNSFQWEGPSPTGQMGGSASWAGVVQVLEDFDSNCNVLGILVEFTGPASGGTLSLNGYNIGVLYSIQYPLPFAAYSDSPTKAVGGAVSWNPDGFFPTYYAHIHHDVNDRGADEYYIGTLHPLGLDLGVYAPEPAVVTNVRASFGLPLELLGQTVYAQAHVYNNRCQCSVTAIEIPGVPPPPA